MYCTFSSVLLAEPYPLGTNAPKLKLPSRQLPRSEGGITYFHIYDRGCSSTDYGDGRGESDCKNGASRSSLHLDRGIPIGSTASYSFDIWITPKLAYEGYYQLLSPTGMDSRLNLAIWEGNKLHNFIYALKASKTSGITFLANQCQDPKDFGKWMRFEMKIKWTNDDTGHIIVSCDDKIVYEKKNIITTINPQCYKANQCEPGVKKQPTVTYFMIGALMAGLGPDYRKLGHDSPFIEIQKDGIEVRIKNLEVQSR